MLKTNSATVGIIHPKDKQTWSNFPQRPAIEMRIPFIHRMRKSLVPKQNDIIEVKDIAHFRNVQVWTQRRYPSDLKDRDPIHWFWLVILHPINCRAIRVVLGNFLVGRKCIFIVVWLILHLVLRCSFLQRWETNEVHINRSNILVYYWILIRRFFLLSSYNFLSIHWTSFSSKISTFVYYMFNFAFSLMGNIYIYNILYKRIILGTLMIK